MSWLSELFGGGGGEDPLAVRQREEARAAQAAREAQAAQARSEEFQRQQMQMQMDYLNQLRADEQTQQAKLEAADPTATRQAALGTVGQYFAPEFESSLISSAATDPLEAAVYGEQRSTADEYLNRLFKRGILTGTGLAAGQSELERQAPGIRAQLNQIGETLIGQGRGKLTDIAGRAREAASNLPVGGAFDISPFTTAQQSELGSFTSGLSDLYRSQVPKDLFDVSSLGAVGGGAQGAGNQPFDPALLASVVPEKTTEDPFSGQKPVQRRTSTVF